LVAKRGSVASGSRPITRQKRCQVLLGIRRQHDVPVARGDDFRGRRVVRLAVADARRLGRAAQVLAPGRGLQVHRRLEQRDLQRLAAPVCVASVQRRQHRLRTQLRRGRIDDRHAHLLRQAIRLARDGHQPALGLRGDVVAGARARRAVAPKPEIDR
jgi:hypothetical protein